MLFQLQTLNRRRKWEACHN